MFSEIAYNKMISRFNDSKLKVGSEYVKSNPGDYSKYTVTDCITFVLKVLQDAFKANGQPKIASQLLPDSKVMRGKDKKPKFYGDMLARKLVNQLNWKAIYITPDRFHPNDGSQEHTFATAMVNRTCVYTGVPVSHIVVDYNPTSEDDPNFKALFKYKPARKLNTIGLTELKKIKFGYGISRKGDHTWLYSEGYVYEAHWGDIGADIFEKNRIEDFIWNSSLIVVPPDAIALLNLKNLNACVKPKPKAKLKTATGK